VGNLHDPQPTRGLHRRRGDVDDDVEGPGGSADEGHREGQLPDRPGKAGEHDGGREEDEYGRKRPGARPVDDASRGKHGGERRQPDREQRGAQLGHRGPDLFLDVRKEHAPGTPKGPERGEGRERTGDPTLHDAVWLPRRAPLPP
jgi:hypothetical protein